MTTTVGSLTNVPNPGSPVASPWPQAVTALGCHPFTNVAAIKAQWPAAPNGARAIALDTGLIYTKLSGVWICREPRAFKHTGSLAAANGQNFNVSFGVTYQAAPIVNLTLEIGSNLDLLPGITAVSTTEVGVRLMQNTNTPITGNYTLHVVVFGHWIA